jgi:hypothetical protein
LHRLRHASEQTVTSLQQRVSGSDKVTDHLGEAKKLTVSETVPSTQAAFSPTPKSDC